MFAFPVLEVVKVIDGDSLRLVIDLGFKLRREVDVRLRDIDAPERHTETLQEGEFVRKKIVEWIDETDHLEPVLKSYALDKYGRVLGDFTVSTGNHLTHYLLSRGFVRKYDGGKRAAWTDKELAAIREAMQRGTS